MRKLTLLFLTLVFLTSCVSKQILVGEDTNENWRSGKSEIVFKNDTKEDVQFAVNDEIKTVRPRQKFKTKILPDNYLVRLNDKTYNVDFWGKSKFYIFASKNL